MPDLRPESRSAARPSVSGVWDWIRGGRSLAFLLVFLAYLIFFMGLLQRVCIMPLAWLRPTRAPQLYAGWIRLQARITLRLLTTLGGMRLTIDGSVAPQSCIVIMNHQSLVDIPIGLALMPGPLPLIPTRRLYASGIPGVSFYLRSARYPLVTQKPDDRKSDLASILDGARRTADGEASILIFPEGHRTRDGQILPFMPGGLNVVFSRARRPVYAIVADGMWRSRTLKDAFFRLAGLQVRVRVIGPFHLPEDKTEIPAFVDHVRSRMIETLDDLRRTDVA